MSDQEIRGLLRRMSRRDILKWSVYAGTTAVFVPVSFFRQVDVNRSSRLCFSLRDESLLGHGLDGPVNNGSVKAEHRGDLILIE